MLQGYSILTCLVSFYGSVLYSLVSLYRFDPKPTERHRSPGHQSMHMWNILQVHSPFSKYWATKLRLETKNYYMAR